MHCHSSLFGPLFLYGGLERLANDFFTTHLVGGDGEDRLTGRRGDDILIGGFFVQSEDRAAVLALLREWTRTDRSYSNRIDNMLDGTGLNDGFVLNETTVLNDGLQDRMNGNGDLDWFLGNNADRIRLNLKLFEVVTDI